MFKRSKVMRKWSRFMFVAILASMSVVSFAQEMSDEKRMSFADNMMDIGEFGLALDLYKEILKEQGESAELLYKLGICTSEEFDEIKALPYFEKSKKSGVAESIGNQLRYDKYKKRFYSYNSDFNLARGYHRLTKFSKAIKHYKLYLLNELDISDRLDAERMLKEAKSGWYLKKNKDFKGNITNMGGPVNSEFSEYGSLILEDSLSIIFTRQQPNQHPRSTRSDGSFKDDVFVVTKRQDGGWFEPYRIDPQLNLDAKEDVAIALSDNDSRLILQYQNGHFFESIKDENGWSEPVKLPKFINSPNQETGLTFGKDLMVVSSNRPSSFGGQDLFVSYMDEKGEWDYLEQLDSNINSPFDEISPYVDVVTNTLYFSSKGHNTMGGFDVFKCLYDSETKKWGNPINLGYPLNTPEDEVYFTHMSQSDIAYYSSNRRNGFGEYDIYEISYGDQSLEMVYLKGKVYANDEDRKPLEAKIKITDADNPTKVASEKTSSETGFFKEKLVKGKSYIVSIKKEGFFHIDTVLTISDTTRLVVELDPIKDGEIIALSSVNFERGKADIPVESYDELDKFYNLLVSNPLLGLEIAGHTEIGGIASQNKELSQKRADAVRDYLINKGIDKKRLLSVGYGSKYPRSKVSGKTGENRRTELVLRRTDKGTWEPFYK